MPPLLPRDILISATLTWPGTLRYIGSHNNTLTQCSQSIVNKGTNTHVQTEKCKVLTRILQTCVVWYTQSVLVRYMGIGHGAVGTCTQSFGDLLSYGSSAFWFVCLHFGWVLWIYELLTKGWWVSHCLVRFGKCFVAFWRCYQLSDWQPVL